MTLQLMNLTVVVRIVEDLQFEGAPASGLSHWPTCIIEISTWVPPEKRRMIFFHELMHLWIRACGGRAKDEEGACDMVAVLFDSIVEQWIKNDGDAQLRALQPIPEKLRIAR